MDFQEAVDTVISITKRRDKQAEIISQLNKAIAFWTLKASFRKDYAETTLTLDANSYGQTLDLTNAAISTPDVTRFRKVAWLRPTSRRYYLKEIDPVHIMTPQGQVQTDRFYCAGGQLTITLSNLDSTLEMGYYSYAKILDLTTNTAHWMLDMVPWMVTERAASQIFRSIGDDISAKYYEASSLEFFIAARNDFENEALPQAS